MTLEKGKTYQVRLTNGAWTDAEFLGEEPYGGYDMVSRALGGLTRHVPKRTRYQFRNLRTGRKITLRSMRKVKEIGGA